MMKTSLLALAVCTFILSAGCESVPTKQDQGVVIGAIVGGILGHQVGGGSGQTLATIVGTLAGAAIGGSIGQSMDESDRLKAAHALETVRTDVSTQWTNPDTGYSYTLTPTQTIDRGTGPCREYTVDAEIGGETQQIYGTACRQADGSWLVVD
jgi:surface antigen